MAKHGIRAPKTPKSEDPAITIANQDLQIKVLIDRCEELRKERESLAYRYENLSEELSLVRSLNQEQAEEKAEMDEAFARTSGWQDCARELIKMMLEK